MSSNWEVGFKILLEFVKVAAWPVLIGWFVHQFKSEIRSLLQQTDRFEGPAGVKWFRRETEAAWKLKEDIKSRPEPTAKPAHVTAESVRSTGDAGTPAVTPGPLNSQFDLPDPTNRNRTVFGSVEERPSARVLRAWTMVEERLVALGVKAGLANLLAPSAPNVAGLIEKLGKNFQIDSKLEDLLLRLYRIQNGVRHKPELELDPYSVEEFVQLARFAGTCLDSLPDRE